ncbi:MAG TPA: urease accessory UreF family protein [Candidatus Brocadiaceae bacterium]
MSNNGEKIPPIWNVQESHLKTFVRALQISDTFFPVGMFNFSHSLESFVQAEMVKNVDDVVFLLNDILSHQIAPADCVALANAYRATEQSDLNTLLLVDEMLYTMKLSSEIREGSVKTGKSLLSNLLLMISERSILLEFNELVRAGVSPGNYAVVLGSGGYLLGIPCPEVMMIELYSFCISFIGAAMRLIKMDHFTAIKIVNGLQPLFIDIIKKYIFRVPDEMYSCAPLVDIMSIRHERETVRMFLS